MWARICTGVRLVAARWKAPKASGAPRTALPQAERTLGAAMKAAQETPAEGVPMHIRNAPTNLMKELGYHAGYQYAHDVPEAYIPQEYLPEKLRGRTFYQPGPFGFEKEIAKRLAWWEELKRRKDDDGENNP